MVNLADAVFGETAALEASGVQSVGMGVAGGGSFREGENISRNGCSSTNERVRANSNEMVHGTERADHSPFFDDNMAAQSCGIGQDDVITDYAVVSNVGVGHDQGMNANARQYSALCGAAIDGNKLLVGLRM